MLGNQGLKISHWKCTLCVITCKFKRQNDAKCINGAKERVERSSSRIHSWIRWRQKDSETSSGNAELSERKLEPLTILQDNSTCRVSTHTPDNDVVISHNEEWRLFPVSSFLFPLRKPCSWLSVLTVLLQIAQFVPFSLRKETLVNTCQAFSHISIKTCITDNLYLSSTKLYPFLLIISHIIEAATVLLSKILPRSDAIDVV